MRKILAATGLVVLASLGSPDTPRAEADWCRVYCETITVGCKVTFGKIDEDYCERWRDGCVAGCRVENRE